ncbi:hypothetical protein FN846DRAFT_954307 [Sphaerosporella brunnea]|uniref:Uncharacterized protein n=1 Tax=Sphaerosporella brunnea TaxID=1250544 RepID=A0A5J5ETD0_9PEZI|nr:hypothetical protein FN846DRAFT_954307 [Sphaerosporella brunnea]
MVSWSQIQSLALFFGPFIWTQARRFYTSTKTSHPPQSAPSSATHILNLLFLTASIALLSTIPQYTPENIFTLTGSRLQTPTHVLFTRLTRIRNGVLTPFDEALRTRLVSKDARLVYAAYGPAPLVECTYCNLDEPNMFLWYALPSILYPHLLHGLVLGIATSSYFSHFGKVWRMQATLAALALFAVEWWFLGMSSDGFRQNAAAKSEREIVWAHWRMRVIRGVGMAVIDAILGTAIWLSATRRWNIGWETWLTEERLKESIGRMEKAGSSLQAARYTKHAILRDDDLRGKFVEWWTRETDIGKQLMDDDEVKQVRTESLPERMNFDMLRTEAEKASRGMMGLATPAMQQPQQGGRPHQA